MKKFLSICLLAFSSQMMAAELIPLPETAQDNGWDIRLVGVHYHKSSDQTEFYYRVRVDQGAATLTSWHLKLKERFAGLVMLNSRNQQLHWHKDLKPGSVEMISFKVKGERTTRVSNYTVQAGELFAEGSIDAPSLAPLASTPMTASYP
ncbi:hypothetical protein ABMA58_04455 [Oceanospirillum sp. HFRX-1_2]